MRCFRIIACVVATLAWALSRAAEYVPPFLPPSGIWTNAGVPGGIPAQNQTIYVTRSATGSDQTAQLNADIAACPAGQVVKLNAGTFRIDGTLNIISSGKVLRGSGVGSTILDCRTSGTAVFLGRDNGSDFPSGGDTVTAGNTQGSTTFTIASTTNYSVGMMIELRVANQTNNAAIVGGDIPVFQSSTGEITGGVRSQNFIIVSKTGTTITVDTPLAFTCGSLTTKLYYASLQVDGSGIEDLTIDGTNGSANFLVWFLSANASWVRGIRVHHAGSFNIMWEASTNCTMTYSQSDTLQGSGGPNGAALITQRISNCAIYDNIFYSAVPLLEQNFGSTGNVFAYNFGIDVTTSGVSGAGYDTNHGPHNSYNLYEGNVGPNLIADGFFGTVSEDLIFRNWFTSVSTVGVNRMPVLLKRFTRRYQIVGNLLGTNGVNVATYNLGFPRIGDDSSFSGTAQPSENDFWTNWPNTYNASAPSPVYGETYYQEKDLDVEASSVFKANYNTQDDAIPAGESIGSDTLANSYWLAGKPTWFYGLAWPAFDPNSPDFDAQNIPAGYRYYNGGANPPADAGGGAGLAGKVTLTGRATIIP